MAYRIGTAVVLVVSFAALLTAGCEQAKAPEDVAAIAETPAAPAAPVPPAEIAGDFTSLDTWQSYGGGPAEAGLVEGAYAFAPNVGAMSRTSLTAKPGDKFTVDYTVKLVTAPGNGKAAQYVVGPMFLDAQGVVLAWGSVETALTEPTRTAHVEAEAPAGAFRAHLYIAGMWAAEAPAPDGKVAYTAAKLNTVTK